MEFAIQTKGLSKTYRGGIEALKPVDLEVPTGSCFGLLGPNGAGKSTLVKALLSIVHATQGKAFIMGVPHTRTSSRRGIGYLPEGHHFPTYLTGRDILRYYGRLSGYGGRELHDSIEKNLGLVGMSDWGNQRVTKYSKGMKQRVGLANALLGSPKVVFLDEPTDGVDPQGRRKIRDIIKEASGQGVTFFINSHLLSEIEKTCDQIGILQKGRILAQGSVENIKAQVAAGSQQSVVFRVREIPKSAWDGFAAGKDATKMDENSFQVLIKDTSDISGLIDELRREGVEIHAVEPLTPDLEDAFISIISSSEKNGEDEA